MVSEMERTMPRLFLCALGLFISGSVLAGDDWPQFRGSTQQGIADVRNLPVQWSETENVAWKVDVPGLGWSSPAIEKGKLFLTTAVPGEGDTQSLRAMCFDVNSGQLLWDKELFRQAGPVEIHSKNSHASATPLISGDRVYVHFGPHGTAALTLQGDVIWTNTELTYGPTHGVGGSPALAGDRLVICCDGHDKQFVAALSTKDGSIVWKKDRDMGAPKGFSFGTPLVLEINGRTQAICPGSNVVTAYDPANGDEIWRCRYEGYSVVPRPVYAGGVVVISTGYDDPILLAIDPTGAGDVTETHLKWSRDRGAPNNPSPVAVGDDLYFVSDNGILSSVNAADGKQRWQHRLGGDYSASLLYGDGKIYVQDEHGRAVVFKPGKKFEEVAENHWAEEQRTYASYAAIDGALFLRSESALYRIQSPEKVADVGR
jgi:outer membrane protein assembly factor BamB